MAYLYDGINAVSVSGNLLLGGLGIDDMFAQVGAGGTTSYLRDALGSTVGERVEVLALSQRTISIRLMATA